MLERFLWLSLCLLIFGCGRDFTAKQVDEPCTRTSQCYVGLICLGGVCSPVTDAGVDAGADGGE